MAGHLRRTAVNTYTGVIPGYAGPSDAEAELSVEPGTVQQRRTNRSDVD